MTATQSLNLYNLSLRYFKNEADATAFVKELEFVIDDKVMVGNKNYENLLHKDLEIIRGEMARKEDLVAIRTEIAQSKTDMIKWFFAFFVTLVLMILGLYATILLKK